ncbi:sensor histidine kinase [Pedobacter duraquae]|uniref:Histidine kinase n=1 Tax=Pedobacter duraquae TaxID=425511 RepID=A0A4R6IG94_9SPHI|nr:histidine kinase [Pedobacter duraquae]TDO20687.1 histidine kinase [Pedobacter duraquae]
MGSFKWIVLLSLILFISPKVGLGQESTFGHNFLFEVVSTQKQTMVKEPFVLNIPDTCISDIFTKFDKNKSEKILYSEPKSKLMLGVKLNPQLQNYFSTSVQSYTKEYPVYLISDSSDAILVAMGINRTTVSEYKYRVVENDSIELISWSAIPRLEQRYGAKQPYGFIGSFNAPGKRILVEVVRRDNYSERDGIIFDWRINFKPILEQIIVSTPGHYFNLQEPRLNHRYASKFDQWRVPEDFEFPKDSITSLLFQFRKQETLAHVAWLIRDIEGKRDTLRLGFLDVYGYYDLEGKYFSNPGIYEFIVQQQKKTPAWTKKDLLRIPFKVIKPKQELYSIKQLSPYFLLLVAVSILTFTIYVQYNRLKLRQLGRQRTQASLKLKVISAQLNPHFIFNALSSIQNLINKNSLLDANMYLSKFAGLTRKVLTISNQEMISLSDELKVAEVYLQLEQLRFGFNYLFKIDETLDIENIEVPGILIQPFIENAVKHGISKLMGDGIIIVEVFGVNHDLVFRVIDNGKGFSEYEASHKIDSYGLKLCRQRLKLMNELYKNQPAYLTVESGMEGTIITITIKHWISNGN